MKSQENMHLGPDLSLFMSVAKGGGGKSVDH